MKTIKMKSLRVNNSASGCMNVFYSYTIPSFSLLLLVSFLSLSLVSTQSAAIAAVDIDTSGDGRVAAYDGEEGIATNGDSFCSITNDIAGGKFSSLFVGIVGQDCDNNPQLSNQFLVQFTRIQRIL